MSKVVEVSNLYDLIKQRRGCYIICADIERLMAINEISEKAGDMAIEEAFQRLEAAASEGDVVFRIGADEFVMITNCDSEEDAEVVAEKVKSYNGQPVVFEGREIPVRLHVGIMKMEEKIVRYGKLFGRVEEVIKKVK